MNEPSKLIEKILHEAKSVAAAEKKTAGEKAAEVLGKAKAKVNDAEKRAEANATAESQERRRRIRSVYDLEHKKDILAMKRGVLDEAFDRAVKDILALPDQPYREMMTRLLLDCSEDGEGEICVSKADEKRLDDAFLVNANKQLKAKTGKGSVTRQSAACDKKGGFVFVRGGMEMDCSVEAVVALAREKMETEVAAILFEEGEKA